MTKGQEKETMRLHTTTGKTFGVIARELGLDPLEVFRLIWGLRA